MLLVSDKKDIWPVKKPVPIICRGSVLLKAMAASVVGSRLNYYNSVWHVAGKH